MKINDAAGLVYKPTHEVAYNDLIAAQAALASAGLKALAQKLEQRIRSDPRTRGRLHALKWEAPNV